MARPSPPSPPSPLAPVLVVDDDDDTRAVLRLLLEEAGYGVLEAADGGHALALLRAAPQPMVVLLDLLLQDCGLRDVPILRAVQAEAGLGRHCYVVVTALPRGFFAPDVSGLIADLCFEVVAKPFNIDEVLDVLRRAEQHLVER